MAFKFIVFAAFVAVARAGVIGVAAPAYSAAPAVSYSSISTAPLAHGYAAAPIAHAYAAPAYAKIAAPVAYAAPVAKAVIAEPYAPAHYAFGYAVSDPHTGDSKSQQESREGDVVHGSYSLIEADGTKRTVEYTADPHNGFNAVVHKEPAAVAVKTVAAAPAAYAAPAYAKVAAPVAYAAPAYTKVAGPLAYAAPVVKYAAPALTYAAGPTVAKFAAPAITYSAAPVAKVSYSAAPAVSYSSLSSSPAYYH